MSTRRKRIIYVINGEAVQRVAKGNRNDTLGMWVNRAALWPGGKGQRFFTMRHHGEWLVFDPARLEPKPVQKFNDQDTAIMWMALQGSD